MAVNLGTPGTTSPGFGPIIEPIFEQIQEPIGGQDVMYDIIHKAYYRQNPNLKFVNVRNKGFVAIKANKDTHSAEWIGFSSEDMLLDYDAARAAAGEGALTATAICLGSYTTSAAIPGSLEANEGCSAIQFATERPVVYNISVPISEMLPEDDETLTDCGYMGCVFGVTDGGDGSTVSPMDVPASPVASPPTLESPISAPASPTGSGAFSFDTSIAMVTILLFAIF